MLKTIFSKKRNKIQIFGASIGAFLGLLLLLLAMQFYFDIRQLLSGADDKDTFVTLNKRISLANTFLGKAVFSESDLQDLRKQSFVEQIGLFTANQFKVSASSKTLGFYTELFFEALPTDFLDIQPDAFRWQEGQVEVPIILSKDYLALYNFGFALSQGLPQFTPTTIQQVSVDVTINGNGRQQTFSGRIVGFSDRINSVLVPDVFMQWANKNFSETPQNETSRLILKVKNPTDKAFLGYLAEKNWEVSTGKIIGGETGRLLDTTLLVIAAIGVVMVILALLVFTLNFQLMVSQSASDIKLLLQIGYRQQQIGKVLKMELHRLLIFVFIAVLLALGLLRWALYQWLLGQGFSLLPMYHLIVIGTSILLIGLIFWFNYRNIDRAIKRAI